MKVNSFQSGVIVLAAGQGKRMNSTLPKVLHPVAGKPMLFHTLNQICEVAPQVPIALVVGHGRELVERYVKEEPRLKRMHLSFVFQPEQRGTGDAVRCVVDSSWGQKFVQKNNTILVLPGDLPALSSGLLGAMLSPMEKKSAMKLLTCHLPDPAGYGRIIRDKKANRVLKILEDKDASPKEKQIQEVAVSIYSFRSDCLRKGVSQLTTKNAQKEYYLTDLVEYAVKSKQGVEVIPWKDIEDLRGVNDLWELAQVSRIMNLRILRQWSRQGVHFLDPSSTWVDVSVELQKGVIIHPGVVLKGNTRIGAGSVLGPRVVLDDVLVGEQVTIKVGTVAEKSTMGDFAQIGPYAHLRPESWVGKKVKIGNFVELKKSRIEEGTSVAHLSYLGDSQVGKNVNIGCGFVTCNYDGRVRNGERKHRTVIEDDVFLGSDCQTVAPVKIGRGAYVASGSTVTEDVPPDCLAIARSRQVNKIGYALKLRQKKED